MSDEIIYPVGYALHEVRRMTKLAFRNRFTAAEKATIELRAVHDPAASADIQMQAASRRALLADLAVASDIQPDRQDLRDSMTILEQWGDIAVGRAAEILDAPIQDNEKP